MLVLLLSNIVDVSDTGESRISSPVSYGEKLPQWFFEGGYIGISDPINDTIMAYNQAVQRALIFYTLSSNVDASIVYEYYYLNANKINRNRENQKSHWISEFDAFANAIDYTVKNVYRTKYNETIVLLDVDRETEEANTHVAVSGSFMYHYEYLNEKLAYGEKQILKTITTDSIEYSEWNSTIDNAQYLKTTTSDEYLNTLKKFIVSYSDAGSITDEMVFSDINFGLWDSFVDTFFQSISIFESKDVVVKNTTRQISSEDNGIYKNKSQDISRLVMKTKISCCLKYLSLKNNKLYANWEIIE